MASWRPGGGGAAWALQLLLAQLLLVVQRLGLGQAADYKDPPYALPTLRFVHPEASMEAHGRFGLAMGTRFAEGIRHVLEQWHALQESWLPALNTEGGRELYDGFLKVHNSTFPEYVQELRGIALGAHLPFEWLFLAQLEQEFAAQLPSVADKAARTPAVVDHCSDYMMCSKERCVDGHNEDNGGNRINHTFLVDAQLGGPEHRFLAFVYMGELPSGAFGVNAAGVGFSLNWVSPPPARRPGLGRGFISRSLLDAHGMADAIARVTRRDQAGGHNLQLLDFCSRSIHNVEVAQDRHALRPVGAEPFFHTNQYQTLDVPGQTLGESSVHRLARVRELPLPHTLEDILRVLGDQGDTAYPVFHDRHSHARGELSDWTLASAAFDLDNRTVTILQGNPREARPRAVWNVSGLIGLKGCDSAKPLILI